MSIIKFVNNNKIFSVVAFIYIILLFTMPHKAAESFSNSMYYVIELMQVIPIIIVLTAIIEAWVPKKTIVRHLGEKSGIKGALISLVLGSVSAGPIYAAFPLCKMLLRRGAGIANIVIILNAWAVIKVPMLANEAKFLGPRFMATRWVLTVISIFVIAYLMHVFVKKEHLFSAETKNKSTT